MSRSFAVILPASLLLVCPTFKYVSVPNLFILVCELVITEPIKSPLNSLALTYPSFPPDVPTYNSQLLG